MAGSTEQRIDFVSKDADEVVPAQLPISLHVTDDRLNGTAPLEFFFHLRGQASPPS